MPNSIANVRIRLVDPKTGAPIKDVEPYSEASAIVCDSNKNVQEELNAIKEKLDEIDTSMGGSSDTTIKLREDLTALEERVKNNTDDIDELKKELTTLDLNVDNVKSSITNLSENIENIENNITNLGDQITEINNNYNNTQQILQENITNITNLTKSKRYGFTRTNKDDNGTFLKVEYDENEQIIITTTLSNKNADTGLYHLLTVVENEYSNEGTIEKVTTTKYTLTYDNEGLLIKVAKQQ